MDISKQTYKEIQEFLNESTSELNGSDVKIKLGSLNISFHSNGIKISDVLGASKYIAESYVDRGKDKYITGEELVDISKTIRKSMKYIKKMTKEYQSFQQNILNI